MLKLHFCQYDTKTVFQIKWQMLVLKVSAKKQSLKLFFSNIQIQIPASHELHGCTVHRFIRWSWLEAFKAFFEKLHFMWWDKNWLQNAVPKSYLLLFQDLNKEKKNNTMLRVSRTRPGGIKRFFQNVSV